jgi:hypothetical protein
MNGQFSSGIGASRPVFAKFELIETSIDTGQLALLRY